MKPVIFLTALLALGLAAYGQTKVEKRIVAQPGQRLVMDFEWPRLIKIQTWDQKDILVKGDVSINKGENDDAFELTVSQTSGEIKLSSILKDEQNIPRRVVINVDGMDYMFKANDMNDPQVQKFLQEKGQHYSYTSNGIIREITLEIFVPQRNGDNHRCQIRNGRDQEFPGTAKSIIRVWWR